MKKSFFLFIITILTPLLLISDNTTPVSEEAGCKTIYKFINTLKGKDFLHYELQKRLLPLFRGTEKEKKNIYYTLIVRMAWKWRKLNISSSIVRDIRIIECKKDDNGNFNVVVELYFHHFLFFKKSFKIKLIVVNSEEGWKLTLPSFSDDPLK